MEEAIVVKGVAVIWCALQSAYRTHDAAHNEVSTRHRHGATTFPLLAHGEGDHGDNDLHKRVVTLRHLGTGFPQPQESNKESAHRGPCWQENTKTM